MTTTAAPPVFGDATYHGSLTDHHGRVLWLDWCECAECWELDLTRHILLLPSGGTLAHVRRESFTEDADLTKPMLDRLNTDQEAKKP